MIKMYLCPTERKKKKKKKGIQQLVCPKYHAFVEQSRSLDDDKSLK